MSFSTDAARACEPHVSQNAKFEDPTKGTSLKSLIESLHAEFGFKPMEAAYDLFIDDGLHSIGANLNSLVFGLRHLKPGGFVVVEDIGPSYFAAILRSWQVIANLLRRDPLLESCMVRTGHTGHGVVKIFVVHKRRDKQAPKVLARACV